MLDILDRFRNSQIKSNASQKDMKYPRAPLLVFTEIFDSEKFYLENFR